MGQVRNGSVMGFTGPAVGRPPPQLTPPSAPACPLIPLDPQNKIDLITEPNAVNQHDAIRKFIQVGWRRLGWAGLGAWAYGKCSGLR